MRLALILAAFAVALPARSAPCNCKDIPSMKARIKEVTNYLEAWRKVLNDCYSENPPRDFEETKKRFDLYAFGGDRPANVQWAGKVTPDGRTEVNPEMSKQYCDAVLHAVNDVHEADHNFYRYTRAVPILLGIAFGHPYMAMIRNTAATEVQAHEVEKAYLEEEVRKLEQGCTWRCKCNQETYHSPVVCSASCPPASLRCVAPTCLEIDPKTGKWTGRGF